MNIEFLPLRFVRDGEPSPYLALDPRAIVAIEEYRDRAILYVSGGADGAFEVEETAESCRAALWYILSRMAGREVSRSDAEPDELPLVRLNASGGGHIWVLMDGIVSISEVRGAGALVSILVQGTRVLAGGTVRSVRETIKQRMERLSERYAKEVERKQRVAALTRGLGEA